MGVRVGPEVRDRAAAWVRWASPEVATVWQVTGQTVACDLPEMGLAGGDRPAADVEVLATTMAQHEYLLAVRLHAAAVAGSLPLQGPGMLAARGWSLGVARRLVRCGGLAMAYPRVAGVWSAGIITGEHVDPIARAAEKFTGEELAAIVAELEPQWGAWSPAAITRFVEAADRMLHPPPDPSPGETDAYQTRHLSFGILGDTIVLTGSLPRVEGELVIAAIDAFAERLRSTADQVRAAARRADALVELVNTAHASGTLPSRGGLPVSLTVTLEHTTAGDPLCTTSRGHLLTQAETRWAGCDAALTPIAIHRPGCARRPADGGASTGSTGGSVGSTGDPEGSTGCTGDPVGSTGGACSSCDLSGCSGSQVEAAGCAAGCVGGTRGSVGSTGDAADSPGLGGSTGGRADAPCPTPAGRIAALATVMFGPREVLGVGRTQRTATPAQRRALAIRDKGCAIPGCRIPAEACQVHHLTEWADGGPTDIDNLVLVCWTHHRQVDLRMWQIQPSAQPPEPPDRAAALLPGTTWPANHHAPFTIRHTPRTRWRN